MEYKEKYEQALERARELSKTVTGANYEYIFPELKESEDERIRRGLRNDLLLYVPTPERYIAWLEKQGEPEDKGEISDGYHTFNELYRYRMLYNAAFFNMLPKHMVHKSKRHHNGEECFGGGWFIVMANLPTGQISNHYELKDWDLFQIPEKEVADEWDGHTPQDAADRLHKYLLERQGENKHTDKAEPKFKVGDWIVDNKTPNDVFCVIEVLEEIYKVIDIDGDDYHIPHCKTDKQFHLWTIEDAKDGDLIYVSTEIKGIQAIFHKFENGIIYFHCNLCSDFTQGGYEPSGDVEFVSPLQKTHYQKFFQKMKEAGYEWDADKKELKKVEPKKLDADEVIEWLDKQACLGWLEDIEVEKVVEQFKKDFVL